MTQHQPTERRELLRRELERRKAAAGGRTEIRRRPAGSAPILSLAQERLWVLDQMFPGRSTYNATMTMRLEGQLHVDALRAALTHVVARHEALRTVIRRDAEGRPQAQLLAPTIGCPWDQSDLRAEPGSVDARLAAAALEPFDLAHDVLLRAHLCRVSDTVHVLMLVTHHIATDGWSRTPLFEELTEFYNAAVEDREAKVADLPVQYSDYAAWQRALVGSDHFDRVVDFWRDEIAGADLLLELPVDRPRPVERQFTGRRLAFDDPRLGEDMRALGRQASATPFMTYLALTATMLHALTGQTDFLLGSPSANRERPETAPLIGFFVDTIILRVRLDGDPTFTEVIGRARTAVLRSLGNPVPLDKLVEALRPRRVPGVNPLFQVNYRMQGAAPPTPALSGLTSTRMFTDTGTSRFDLAFGFVDTPGPLRAYFEYDGALFDETTVQAWADTLLILTAAVVGEPTRRLSELTALAGDELRRRRPAPAVAAAPARRAIRRIRPTRTP
ncbi:condensation domain-containing protein [uncultured Jatrophihabitans sp.]|uniref:condensation domain-containing protein n=1 Tax=uncultured Jatrophihabitans sp. TaxID=1610747 RepID=UPI0035CAFE87